MCVGIYIYLYIHVKNSQHVCIHVHTFTSYYMLGRHGQIQLFYCNFDIKKEKKIYAHDTRGYLYIVDVYILGILFV